MATFDVRKTREFLRNREESRRAARELLHRRASQDLRKIVALLIEKYRPTRIYTWGSVLDARRFTERSDIDVAVEGLGGPLDGLHAKSDAEELTQFRVDLVELERIHPLHAETIRSRGSLIYERQ